MKKKIIFTIILILIPILFLVIIEFALRIIGYGQNLSLFLPSKNLKDYYKININVGRRFFTKNDPTQPGNDLFLIHKPSNGFRVFVLGASTAQGFPYDMNISFSRILYYRLKELYPERPIEVINVSMAAVNSYALADFIDEILKQKPDVILIYAGHNEYYGALGVASTEGSNISWVKKIHLKLIHLRIYQFVQNQIIGIFNKTQPATATLMQRIVKNKSIPFGSPEYEEGIKQFENNLIYILKKTHKAGVPVIISELVSNVRNLPPFQSESYKNVPPAISIYKEAIKAEASGNLIKAKELYYKAKDLDCIRFRAPEDINNTIHKLAKEWKIPVIPMKSLFEEYSLHGIIGNELILEHLHPNIKGYFLIADAFLKKMIETKIINQPSDSSILKPFYSYRAHWGYTELDSLTADKRIKSLMAGWPFQPDTVVNLYIYNYKPTSLIDSLSLLCLKYDNLSLTQMHRELALNYINEGKIEPAFYEYLALVYTNPYIMHYYVKGLQLAEQLSSDTLAFLLLKDMPFLDSTYFALMKLGKVFLKWGKYNIAFNYFSKAQQISQNKIDKIYAKEGLYFTYLQMGNKRMAQRMLMEIRELDPNYRIANQNKKDLAIIVDPRVKPLIENAIDMARKKNFDEAIRLLRQSIEIQKTAIAYQLLGSVLFQVKDPQAFETLEKAYELNPADENTINNLVVLSVMLKKKEKALFYLDKYKHIGQPNQFKELQTMVKKTFSEK